MITKVLFGSPLPTEAVTMQVEQVAKLKYFASTKNKGGKGKVCLSAGG